MVATSGFFTKSNLCEGGSTCEFLIRRLRLSRAFVSTEPEHSFKNNINNITSLLSSIPHQFSASSLHPAFRMKILEISFSTVFLKRRFFWFFLGLIFDQTLVGCEYFGFGTVSDGFGLVFGRV